MNLREQIACQRNSKIVASTMEYPATPQKNYEWFMRTVPSKNMKNKEGEATSKFEAAWVQIVCCGFKDPCDYGSVALRDPDFVEKWTQLVARCKLVVDALNLDPAVEPGVVQAALAKGVCANCDRPSTEGDFLCDICRAA